MTTRVLRDDNKTAPEVQIQWRAFREAVASASTTELQALLAVWPYGARHQIVRKELRHRHTGFQRRGAM